MQGIVILLTSAPSEALEVILYSFYFLLLAEGVEKNSTKVFAALLAVGDELIFQIKTIFGFGFGL